MQRIGWVAGFVIGLVVVSWLLSDRTPPPAPAGPMVIPDPVTQPGGESQGNPSEEGDVAKSFPKLSPVAVAPGSGSAVATFGAGCFWCSEAVFLELRGVTKVVSGYSGGSIPNPTYEQICTGRTGHAEVVRVTYDPAVISYAELLEAFWRTHDPTTLNRQGADVGTQYRSVVYFHDDAQRQQAEEYKRKIDEAGVFDAPVVTEISPAVEFYPAEAYHQNYYAQNPYQPYCQAVVGPKVQKLRAVFGDKLKSN